MPRGKLIVLEGPEGVGKTTQVARLSEHLQAVQVPHVTFREPGGTELGERIRSLLLHDDFDIHARAETLLFLAARAQLAHVIGQRLELGEIVLLDRFFLSTLAYQSRGRLLSQRDEEAVLCANRFAIGNLRADITIILLYPYGAGLERVDRRGKRDRIERAGLDFHERVARAFGEFTEPEWSERLPELGEIEKVNAQGDVEEVFDRVLNVLSRYWPETFRPGPRSHRA
ncbi:MAG TPA: dTMP kinase [Gemmatimonadaceae bacterium]|nr:dTMP kinase [Gemmatimonadaceae bacterium]